MVTLRPAFRHTVCPDPAAATKIFEKNGIALNHPDPPKG
jgi:hypothetical protein